MDDRENPLTELERDESEELLFLETEARWILRVLKLLLAVSSVLGAAWLACTLLLGSDFPGRSVLRWSSRMMIFAVIFWIPMLMMGFAWSAKVRRNKAVCYSLAIALFAVVVIGTPWLLANAL